MDEFCLYSKILLNEGAYFFRRGEAVINRKIIKELFKKVSEECDVLSEVLPRKESLGMPHYHEAFCSLLVVKKSSLPSFLDVENDDVNVRKEVTEIRLGYLLIVEIDRYVVIIKKNVSRVSSFVNQLETIDGDALSGVLVTESTVFQQIRMTSMSVNANSMKNKSLEANNLQNSMSTFASNQNIVTSTRFSTEDGICTLNVSTSRMSKFGKKKSIVELLGWIDEIAYSLDNYHAHATFLTKFAKPMSWKSKGDVLQPNSLLIDTFSLLNYINAKLDHRSIYLKQGENDYQDVSDRIYGIISNGNRTLELRPVQKGRNVRWMNCAGFGLSKTKTKLNLVAEGFWEDLYLKSNEGSYMSVVKLIGANSYFSVGFDSCSYIYTGGKLFENASITEDFDSILSILEPKQAIANVCSEKGEHNETSIDFCPDSMFHVVEHEIFANADYLICDDMGNEWADHIAISGDTVSFVHSKCKSGPALSASCFQEVIGQAIKNIGNLSPSDEELERKKESWDSTYWRGTRIAKVRKGTADGFVRAFRSLRVKPNRVKEVCLAIDFLSKSQLTAAFDDIKEKRPLQQKNTVIQMVWLLNAFISSCKEADLHCRIFCNE